MPGIYRTTYERAVNRQSMRSAVNSTCLECTQWQREEIHHCTALACPLYAYRPYQASEEAKIEALCDAESANAG